MHWPVKYLKDKELDGTLTQKKIITDTLSYYLCNVKRKYAEAQIAE